jgi:Flp pilus assembly protein TadD
VELAAALDDWEYVKAVLIWFRQGITVTNHFRVTRLLDPDPLRNRIRDAVAAKDRAALKAIADEIDPAAHPVQTVNLVSVYLYAFQKADNADQIRYLRKVQPRHPGDFQINHNLAFFLNLDRRYQESIPYALAAIAVRPNSAVAWEDYARGLRGTRRYAEAAAAYRRVVELSPRAWNYLGHAGASLEQAGNRAAAVAEYRRAAALAVKYPTKEITSDMLSRWEKHGLTDEVVAGLRTAAAHDPADSTPRYLLCDLLAAQGKSAELVKELARFTRLDPRAAADFQLTLGHALAGAGQVEKAVAAFREAVRLAPKSAAAHDGLASALWAKGDLAAAVAAYRQRAALTPKSAAAHSDLAAALAAEGDPDGAVAAYREAIRLGGRSVSDYNSLAAVLATRNEPLAALRVLEDAARIDRAWMTDPETYLRYNTACCALLAAAGAGKDSPGTADRPALRRKALACLTADLAAWRKLHDGQARSAALVHRTMLHWLRDADLASVRGAKAVGPLPAGEQAGWARLWADVRALRDATRREVAPRPRPAGG